MAPSHLPFGWQAALLDPRAPALPLCGRPGLGIELTSPVLAAQCTLGNIDPQHGQLADANAPAAIEAAVRWPLPPDDACLWTLRPDADAIGAMAVLLLRRQGRRLGAAQRRRIALVAQHDRFALGDWEAWRRRNPPLPLPASAADLGDNQPQLLALAVMARPAGDDLALPILQFAHWLLSGTLPADAMQAAHGFTDSLVDDWNCGAIRVEVTPGDCIALVRADHAGGLRLGYRRAPVVLAEAQLASGRKLTVAAFEPGWLDRNALLTELAAREPGWGGSATILGSPQGAPCRLPLDTVIAAVSRHLQPIGKQYCNPHKPPLHLYRIIRGPANKEWMDV